MLAKNSEPLLQKVARRGAFAALAIGTLFHPLTANADELGRQASQAGNIRGLERNITNAEAVRPLEVPAPINISPAPQVDINKLIPTAFVEMGDSR